MRLIKMFLTGIIGLALLMTIFGLLIPATVKISRGIIINAPDDSVMQELKDVSNWKEWLPWLILDSSAKAEVSAITNEKGSFIKWVSGDPRRGQGKITIKELLPDEIKTINNIPGLPEQEGGFRIRATRDSTITQLEWYLAPKMKWYPWERFYGIFVDRTVSPALDYGLNRLKEIIEQRK